jgi:subtilisin family serine protease
MKQRARFAVLLLLTLLFGAERANAQGPGPGNTTTVTTTTAGHTFTALQVYGIGSFVCAVVSPMVGTVVLGREMTPNEVAHTTLGCVGGPIGWAIADHFFPLTAVSGTGGERPANQRTRTARGRNFNLPPAGEVRFVQNEVLTVSDPRTMARIAQRLQLTLLETQNFALIGRSMQRWRIDSGRSVSDTIRALGGYGAQPNYLYALTQMQAPVAPAGKDSGAPAQEPANMQYVIAKLHLREAHQITSGDEVAVAVIDSGVDADHPELAGVVAERFDALGGPMRPHSHGTGMAGAIAAHAKLVGVAPKVKLLAARAFSGTDQAADGTTFNIVKAFDWAAARNARVINMSFAGPSDPIMRSMLDRGYARGIVMIAAVGNSGPNSPPLFPAADVHVIGVTATDAEDKLLSVANRGPHVAFATPGVQILVPSPGGSYQLTSGTSVATAHASGVAALLLARKALKPDQVRAVLSSTALPIAGSRTDYGAGIIDAYKALNSLK